MLNKNGIPINRQQSAYKPSIDKNVITTFAIANEKGEHKIYKVLGTRHSFERFDKYRLNKYQVSGLILSLGDKLNSYNDSGKHILLPDEDKDISVVFTIENYTIVLITVIDRGDSLPSLTKETVVEKIS